MGMMSAILERGNMMRAYERVHRNKGAPGVDGMTVEELKPYLKAHWPEIREQLRAGRYQPLPVRKVEIPKPGGGRRMLGIPSVRDRLIQQALHQILSPLFEETFSTHSYGFRAGRSAALAVQQARSYVEKGRFWVVDADLEKFFDRVNREKCAVDRPWKRSFLGYTVCHRKYKVSLKVAPKSVLRLKGNLKALFRSGRGRSIRQTIADLAPKIRGWVNYFRYAGVKGVFEELDGWIRRHLRKILWRQWKRTQTRAKMLMRLGLSEARAWTSATNGRGPWWNSGASHLNQALPKKLFDRLGLVSLMDQYHRLERVARTAVVRNRMPGGVRGRRE